MSTVALISAKGSPGVTTTTVGLALSWSGASRGRRCLVFDADPSGGDTAAGFLRGSTAPHTGMLAVATSRGLSAYEAIEAAAIPIDPDGSARLLPGVPDAARSAALPLAWERVADSAGDLESEAVDLLVDGGRHDPARPPGPWLVDADLVVLVVRPTLPAVAAANRLARAWSESDSPTRAVALGVLVVEAPSPYGAAEVASAVGAPLQGVLPHEPEHARVFSEGRRPGRGFARSAYLRGLHRVAHGLSERGQLSADHARGVPAVRP